MNRLIIVGVFAILFLVMVLVWIILPRFIMYKKIFSIQHFKEIHQRISDIKEAAVRSIPDNKTNVPIKRDDSRALITNEGLAILYTITKYDNVYDHHFSVSMNGRYTPHAVGEDFSLFVADILSWNIHEAQFYFTETPIYHASLEMSEEEHIAWEIKLIAKFGKETKDDLRRRIQELRNHVQFPLLILKNKNS